MPTQAAPSPIAECVKIAGSLEAGVLLQQLAYWFGSDRKWKPRANIQINDKIWVAKTWDDLRVETGLTERQLRRALTRLKEIGVIETVLKKFQGNPTTHLHLHVDRFLTLKVSESTCTQVSNPVRTQVYKSTCTPPSETYTAENYSENYAETSAPVAQTDSSSTELPIGGMDTLNYNVVEIDFRNKMATAKEILKAFSERNKGPTGDKPRDLALLWKKRLGSDGEFVKDLTGKEMGQLKDFAGKVGEGASHVLDWCLLNWSEFAFECKTQKGLGNAPEKPVVGWLLKYCDVGVTLYRQSIAKQTPVQTTAPPKKVSPTPVAKAAPEKISADKIAAALAKVGKGSG